MSEQFQFQKATKRQAKLRLAIFGPSGSGKTKSALRIATGLEGKIAVIDTERGSASKYAGEYQFDVLDLDRKNIDTYVEAIDAAAKQGYPVLIVDSLTHAWKELLAEVDKLAYSKFKGNTWAAWSKGTPKQMALVESILSYPGHIITTMRSKTEWMVVKDSEGRDKPQRVGLGPEQGKGIEYEFDLLMELNTDHVGKVLKDRTGKFQDESINLPGEDFGRQLIAWLNEGEAVPVSEARPEKPVSGDPAMPLNGDPVPPQSGDSVSTPKVSQTGSVEMPSRSWSDEQVAVVMNAAPIKDPAEARDFLDGTPLPENASKYEVDRFTRDFASLNYDQKLPASEALARATQAWEEWKVAKGE